MREEVKMIIRIHYFSVVVGAVAGALLARKYWSND
jgi:hypothetical protein